MSERTSVPMGKNEKTVGLGLAALLLPSLLLGPLLGNALVLSPGISFAHLQVTIAPPAAEFPTPFGDVVPTATPIPTLGPGQSFEQDSFNRPETITQQGDDQFGYGRIQGSTSSLLIWFTDEAGTHYLVVDENSEAQKTIVEEFKQAIGDRETKGTEIEIKDLEIEKATRTGRRNETFTIGLAVAGGICGLLTGGICIPFALAAVAAYGLSWDPYFEQERLLGERDIVVGQLTDIERNLGGTYLLLASTTG